MKSFVGRLIDRDAQSIFGYMNANIPAKTADLAAGKAQQGGHPLTLVYESGHRRKSVDDGIIRASLSGPVLVMDAGNCFNPLRLVRTIRQQTLQVQQVLEHIQVARAFTCFQVAALLEQSHNPQGPVFLLRPLTTFCDEMVPIYERLRLLEDVDRHIARLRTTAVVTVMVKNRCFEGDPLLDWLGSLQDRADEIIFPGLISPAKPAQLF